MRSALTFAGCNALCGCVVRNAYVDRERENTGVVCSWQMEMRRLRGSPGTGQDGTQILGRQVQAHAASLTPALCFPDTL